MASTFPLQGEPEYPRSAITFTQIETFLTLVEEGGVARAAERLGVGRSTVSAHAKIIADEIGHQHFRRHQGGQIDTVSGLEAYGRLRTLLLQATFAFEHFRSANPLTASFTTVRLPFGFPASAFDRVLERKPGHFWAQYLNALCLLRQGRPAEARVLLGACLAQRSDFVWLYLLRGYAQGELQAWDAADADFQKALSLSLDEHARYVLLVDRGVMRVRQERFDDAIQPRFRPTDPGCASFARKNRWPRR